MRVRSSKGSVCFLPACFLEKGALLPSFSGAWGRPATETNTLTEEGCSLFGPVFPYPLCLPLLSRVSFSLHVRAGRL